MKWLVLAALALTFCTHEASAQRVTKIGAGQLGNLCISKEHNKLEACRAYLDGVADAIAFYQKLLPADGSKGGKLPDYICIPADAKLPETFVSWLREHKDYQHRTAQEAAMNALNASYKCKGE